MSFRTDLYFSILRKPGVVLTGPTTVYPIVIKDTIPQLRGAPCGVYGMIELLQSSQLLDFAEYRISADPPPRYPGLHVRYPAHGDLAVLLTEIATQISDGVMQFARLDDPRVEWQVLRDRGEA